MIISSDMLQIKISDVAGARCIGAQTGDRFGIFIETAPSSVCYKFDAQEPLTVAYHRLDPGDHLNIPGDIRTFEYLALPYELSMAAYVDTGENI